MQIGLNLALTLEHGGAGAPTLDMTFTGTGNALDSRITFTRASGATWFNSAGVLQGVDFSVTSNTIGTGSKTFTLTATGGVNRYWTAGDTVLISDQANSANNMVGTVTSYNASTQVLVCNITSTGGSGTLTAWRIGSTMPRFDYNPATLAARGLLIEEQRTNLFQRSEEFNDAYWNLVVSASVTANATTAPSSTVTADKIVEAAASSVHYLGRNNVLLAAATTCSVSVFAKASERSFIGLQLTPDGTNYIYCTFNLATGVASTPVNAGNGSGATAAISAVGNGWYRCTLSGVPSSTAANPVAAFYVGNANVNLVTSPYLGDGTSGIFLWGAQLEAGAFPTSYIPTTVAAVTRSADVASVNTLSPWFNSTVGTIYVEASNAQVQASLFSTDDGTASNRIVTYFNAANSPAFRVVSGGVDQCNYSAGTITQNAAFKLAAAYQVNDFAASLNGAAVVTDTSGTIPTGQTTARIGTNVSLANSINGYLRRITYYPTRLSNAQLQAITA